MIPASLIARALSRLLSHDDAARKLLAAHRGETLQVRTPPFALTLRVTDAGDFAAVEGAASADDVSCSVEFPLTSLPLLAQGKEAALRSAKVAGKAALLQDVSKAFSSLPLAAEAELERVVGPILANEAVQPLYTWGVQILATDLSKRVLEVGRRATYPKARLDTMPPEIRTQYFHDLGDQIRVKDGIRQSVTFMQHNLRDPFPSDRFDVIFCRNVMIYFSRQDQIRLAQRFHDYLAPEGFLFIGHSESLQGLNVGLQMRLHNGGVAYQKV